MPSVPILHPERLSPPGDTHVIVGLSGGVDSSVAAKLLVDQGYHVTAVFMQNWEDDDEQCTARQDYRDAAGVADALGIPLQVVNFADDYWERVFAHFLAEYEAGRTPNPDILCNREIKFRAFLDHARRLGADAIATGHYARLTNSATGSTLLRGRDPEKDQSYFLHTLGQAQLDNAMFPVGEIEKQSVREIARTAGLHVHGKKDSTGICFIGERKFTAFLADYLPARKGPVVTEAGRIIGEHNGLMFHTLGQRQGLGIGGRAEAGEAPWYVLAKNLASNTLVVGQGHEHPRLLRTTLAVKEVHWVAGSPPAAQFQATARVRYRQADQPVTISVTGAEGTRLIARFDNPVRAATPGQSLVIYDAEVCLGGGIIDDFPGSE